MLEISISVPLLKWSAIIVATVYAVATFIGWVGELITNTAPLV